MTKLIKLSQIFNTAYGNSLSLTDMVKEKNGIPFVARTEKNNGIVAHVKAEQNVVINPGHTITVALSGSVLSSFYQALPFYTGFHVLVLKPKQPLTRDEMLFYSKCIQMNKYRYNYGRQANKTLKDILIPSQESLPAWVEKTSYSCSLTTKSISNRSLLLKNRRWDSFRYHELFTIKKGKRLIKTDMNDGVTPFIAAIDSSNGLRQFIDQKPIHKGNTITVNYNGSVAEAFYQSIPFWASDDVNVLYPKFDMNEFSALFIVSLIKLEKYRFNYGRKWHLERMEDSIIKLPTNMKGDPDWKFIENYMKSLPYSKNLENLRTSSP